MPAALSPPAALSTCVRVPYAALITHARKELLSTKEEDSVTTDAGIFPNILAEKGVQSYYPPQESSLGHIGMQESIHTNMKRTIEVNRLIKSALRGIITLTEYEHHIIELGGKSTDALIFLMAPIEEPETITELHNTIQDYAQHHNLKNYGAQLLPHNNIEKEYPNGWFVKTKQGDYWVWFSQL